MLEELFCRAYDTHLKLDPFEKCKVPSMVSGRQCQFSTQCLGHHYTVISLCAPASGRQNQHKTYVYYTRDLLGFQEQKEKVAGMMR